MECLTSVPVFVRSEKLRSEKNREFDLKSRKSIKKNVFKELLGTLKFQSQLTPKSWGTLAELLNPQDPMSHPLGGITAVPPLPAWVERRFK